LKKPKAVVISTTKKEDIENESKNSKKINASKDDIDTKNKRV